jgi:phytoene/squalene synthetase
VASLRDLVERARQMYQRSHRLEQLVHPAGRPCLVAMTRIYGGLLEQIARRPEAVLAPRRVSLPRWRKVCIALRAVMR